VRRPRGHTGHLFLHGWGDHLLDYHIAEPGDHGCTAHYHHADQRDDHGSPGFALAGRGRYYFPVQPPDSATYSSTHHDYPATDIYAPGGTTVVAVTDGVIHEVSRTDSWDPDVDDGATRAGLFVTILGTDGIRYHVSHLDIVEPGIEPGRPVRAGEPIGTVGMTGNARSPHVHFGISRPGGPGDWEVRRGEVWPYEYLQAWTDGQDLTPVLPDG
jgi:murein DD-endopeptidase MepM/ murein hydrolase activator NlpD